MQSTNRQAMQRMERQFNEAFQALAQRDLRRAEKLCKKLLAVAPSHPDLTYLAGAIAHASEDSERAEQWFRKSLAANPNHPGAISGLGLVLRDKGAFEEALTYLDRARRAAPNDPAILNAIGITLHDVGHSRRGEEVLRSVIKRWPKFVTAYVNLARILHTAGQYHLVETVCKHGLKIDPGNTDLLRQLYIAQDIEGTNPNILEDFEALLSQRPNDITLRSNYVMALTNAGKLAEALDLADASLKMAPTNPFLLAHKGKLLSALGRREDAEEVFREISENSRPESHAIDHRAHWHFSVAESLESLRDYPRAFENYAAGNALMHQSLARSGAAYSASEVRRTLDEILEKRQGFANRLANPLDRSPDEGLSPTPIFVVGMPRSGTTLLNQILGSHPEVAGAGELTIIPKFVEQEAVNGRSWIDLAVSGDRNRLRGFAQSYLGQIPDWAKDSRMMVDKLPENYWFLGLIMEAFPNAKVIHSLRHPMDTCLSLFCQYFSSTIRYSARLDDLAVQYRLYAEMMDVWADIYGDRIFSNYYETLTGDFEDGCRRLIDFAGLDWSDQVLEFNKNQRQVITASKYQVRQGIYKTSVEKWRRYERVLEPLRAQIADLIDNYEARRRG